MTSSQAAADPTAGGPASAEVAGGPVEQLLARSNALGSDRRVTNYAGGNTSCKAADVDPVTGEPRQLLYVKGSGGDLGTLRRDGLAVLVMDRLEAIARRWTAAGDDDAAVLLIEQCRCPGVASAAPSIDTAMHGLLPHPHVDHLHPDSVIAFATAADGEELVEQCFGGEVGWMPWRRPGFGLAVQIAELVERRPGLRGVVLGGHGLTAWGASSDQSRDTSLEIIRRCEEFIAARDPARAFGAEVAGALPLAAPERRRRAAALFPHIRGLASADRRQVGHFTDDPVVLDFLSREAAPRLVSLGTSCPDHFLRTKVRPLLLDLPADAPLEAQLERLTALHAAYRQEYEAYYLRHAGPDSPAMRGADPAIFLVPGVGMFSFGADPQTARVAGEFYINAINVMRGAEAISTYRPIDEAEKFGIEYWELEEAKLRRLPPERPLSRRVALITGATGGIGSAIARRFAAEGASVVIADLDLSEAEAAAADIGERAFGVRLDVTDEESVQRAFAEASLRFGGVDLLVNNAGISSSHPLVEHSLEDYERLHAVIDRGSFLMSRAFARQAIAQGLGGDIVYVISKNAVVAGPDNVGYGSAKAAQLHQMRLLAAELGGHGIRVNGVNPDAVVRGSKMFASGWGADRAAKYGVDEERLGEYYAQRTVLKREVLPDDIASACLVLVGGGLEKTTGAVIPVDGGVTTAFLR
jgi:rhamnulose-1-phosphate aldolase/alcohol dehydrogenase